MEFPKLRNLRVTLIPVLLILVTPFIIFAPLVQQKSLLRALNETVHAVGEVVKVSQLNGTHGA